MSQQEDDLRALAKIMDFHFSGHERVLVLLRSHPLMGSKYWGS